ncbi:MAG: aminotransferase class IV [Acidobacteriota bacterium]
MTATVYVNGRIGDDTQALISVLDHGFLYGDGVYEVIRTYGRRPFALDRHLRRLRQSARLLDLPLPHSDPELKAVVDSTVRAHLDGPGSAAPHSELYVRVVVTRGIGELSYAAPQAPPSLVAIVKTLPPHDASLYERGVRAVIVPMIRNHPQSVNPRIKSNNLLNSAMAMREAARRGAFEGIFRNYRGELAECAMSNLFVVQHGVLKTPPLDAGILGGITREIVLELAAARGVPAQETALHDEDLFGASEAFVSVTTRELVPVVDVDGRPIGSGVPGDLTRALLGAYRAFAQRNSGGGC